MSAEEKNNSENTQSVLDKRTTGKYAILMESNDEEFEVLLTLNWNILFLHKQLRK